MARFLAILLAFLVHAAGSQDPVFQDRLHSYVGERGTDLTLQCTVLNLGDRTVAWRRVRDAFPISVGHTYFTPSRKYFTAHDKTTGVWSLTIRRLSWEDAGEYECRVTGTGTYVRSMDVSLAGSSSSTHFEDAPRTVKTRLGNTVTLPCTVRNLGRRLVMWKDSRGEVISVRKKNYYGDRRFRVQQSGGRWHLRIRNVAEGDLGRYSCIVNTDPVQTRSVFLNHDGPLPEPPSFVRDGFEKTRTVREGDPLTITCRFTGFPAPSITWNRKIRRNGRSVKEDLKESTGTLTLPSVKVEDEGTYNCRAHNGNPPSAGGRVKVTVEPLPTTVPPKTTPPVPTGPTAPRIYAVEERVGGQIGWPADLACVAVGDPAPHVHWKRHGHVVRDDFLHRVTSSLRDQYTSETTLRVRTLLDPNFGDYECHAANPHGTDRAMVHLHDIHLG